MKWPGKDKRDEHMGDAHIKLAMKEQDVEMR